MLEYFTYKKVKKHRQEKEEEEQKTAATGAATTGVQRSSGDSVLDADEQLFLERLTLTASHSDGDDRDDDDGDGERPPLPPRMKTPELMWDSDSESFVREDERRGKGSTKGTSTSTSSFGRRLSQLLGPRRDKAAHLVVPGHVDVDVKEGGVRTAEEEARERDEIARVLEELDKAAGGDKNENDGKDGKDGKDSKTKARAKKMAFVLSSESTELVRRFVVVLKDLVSGVPTAADDLRHLLDDRDGTLSRGFERLPSGLRKLVAQLPAKLTASLAPELLAAAAESQGLAYAHKDGSPADGAKAAAKALFLPLLTKPSSVVKMLKAIMNALKLRWPAFIGTSAIWSVALFILLFVLWYCHKRGREVRLGNEAEAAAASAAALDTDTPAVIRTSSPPRDEHVLPVGQLPPPPIGSGAAVPRPE